MTATCSLCGLPNESGVHETCYTKTLSEEQSAEKTTKKHVVRFNLDNWFLIGVSTLLVGFVVYIALGMFGKI